MREVILIVHNVRSAHNVGSLLRTADGLGIKEVVLSGYSPYPKMAEDERLPHLASRTAARIHKTALGAETSVKWRHVENIDELIDQLHLDGYGLAALEQAAGSIRLNQFAPPAKLALIVGSEVGGLDRSVLGKCGTVLEIPMRGGKESFNVAAAAAMALYSLTYLDKQSA